MSIEIDDVGNLYLKRVISQNTWHRNPLFPTKVKDDIEKWCTERGLVPVIIGPNSLGHYSINIANIDDKGNELYKHSIMNGDLDSMLNIYYIF